MVSFPTAQTSLTKEQLEKSSEWLYDTRTWSRLLSSITNFLSHGLDPISLQEADRAI